MARLGRSVIILARTCICSICILIDRKLVLVYFNALEKVPEVALAESPATRLLDTSSILAAQPLDDFDEDGGSVSERLGEDLQQDALVVLVDEDAHLLGQYVLRLSQALEADTRSAAGIVVCGLGSHELKAPPVGSVPHQPKGSKYVIREERHVLHPLALVLLEVSLNLGLALGAVGGLVYREKDHLVVVGEHYAVEAAVDCAHVLCGELGEVVETQHVLDVVLGGLQGPHIPHYVVEAIHSVLTHPLQPLGWRFHVHVVGQKLACEGSSV
mmetsp:Transcript_533/g.1099  ORF Transcript_533/g.1099 Transcript_533/m.1099 type:complete len:271 (-) Transcript_533:533-1345(-)